MNQPVERRLAAILAADVAGYSRLMGADEERDARTPQGAAPQASSCRACARRWARRRNNGPRLGLVPKIAPSLHGPRGYVVGGSPGLGSWAISCGEV
jgi:hypothetical protein